MNLSLISQIFFVSSTFCASGVLVFNPKLLGIYPNVELYAMYQDNIILLDHENYHLSQNLSEDNVNCWIRGQENKKYDCKIFMQKLPNIDTKQNLNPNSFNKKINSKNFNLISRENKYYKIIVSLKLIEQFKNNQNSSIVMSVRSENEKKQQTKSLKPLFVNWEDEFITFVNDTTPHYLGQAKLTNSDNLNFANTISKTKTQKYMCSTDMKKFNECSIYLLRNNNLETDDINDFDFYFNSEDTEQINEEKWYLFKNNNHKWSKSIYVSKDKYTSDTVNAQNIIQIKNLKKALIWTHDKTKTLFVFE